MQWIYKINETNSVTNFTEADSVNRKSLYTLSPSNDSEATISLNCKIPFENSNININSVNTFYNTFDLTFLPSFKENGITNIVHNDPFKGGAITKYLYNIKDVDVVQLEINSRYRDYNNIDKLELLCKCLEKFILQYIEYTRR